MKLKISKDTALCITAIFIIVLSYAAERVAELFATPSLSLGLITATALTALLGIVIYILSKTNDSFTGLLAALIGYKMMPANIPFLQAVTLDGTMLYYLVQKAAALVFLIVAFRLYNRQEQPRKITALPLLAMIFAVPFTNEISKVLSQYFLLKTGSMLGGYFSQYACYAAASLVILALAFVSTYSAMRFAAYFEFTALSINILRYAAKIAYHLYSGTHISKSYYGWILLYAALIAIFFIAKQIKKKNVYNI
ncbi:MAG: hypothetical protein IJ168_10180 [Eubacterium sp.]|nr:hypothetical protein [Eubacterium sp.]